MEIESIKQAVQTGSIEWKLHGVERLIERGIRRSDVLSCMKSGKIIERYPDDKPYPSCLIFNEDQNNPLHVVVAYDEDNLKIYVITVYEPSLDEFEPDYKTRRED